ncbi:MAG: hypothetical protein WCT19_04085 [Candidatus Paceibacterota bacterium]
MDTSNSRAVTKLTAINPETNKVVYGKITGFDPLTFVTMVELKIFGHRISAVDWMKIINHVFNTYRSYIDHFPFIRVKSIPFSGGRFGPWGAEFGNEEMEFITFYPDRSVVNENTRLIPLIRLHDEAKAVSGPTSVETLFGDYLLVTAKGVWVMLGRGVKTSHSCLAPIVYSVLTDDDLQERIEVKRDLGLAIITAFSYRASRAIETKEMHAFKLRQAREDVLSIQNRIH